MKKMTCLFCGLVALTAAAQPEISSVSMTQAPGGGTVTISYSLSGGPAVVTLDIVTNGVSIGRFGLGAPKGDCNALVSDGTHRIKWRPADTLRTVGIAALNAQAVLTAWSPNRMPDYLVCDLTGGDRPRYYADEADLPGDQGAQSEIYKTEKLLLKFVRARGVEWLMGAATNEAGFIGWNEEKNIQVVGNQGGEPLRRVRLSQNYYLGVYEVTQGQYRRVTGQNPLAFADADDSALRPVENVSYNMLRDSTSKGWPAGGHAVVGTGTALAQFRAKTSLAVDLPTEAQWEYACRAGTGSPFAGNRTIAGTAATAKDENDATAVPELDAVARYAANGQGTTAPVGSPLPNAFGFYDLHGNVSEWCLDYCNPWPAADVVVDPTGGDRSQAYVETRVLKGGAYNSSARRCRSAARRFNVPNGAQAGFGFRLCWTVEEGE